MSAPTKQINILIGIHKSAPRMTRARLRSLAVVAAAKKIFDIRESLLSSQEDTITEVRFDIGREGEETMEEAISLIMGIVDKILISSIIHPKDKDFFNEKYGAIIRVLLQNETLDEWISFDLSFAMMLFHYFADGTAKQKDPIFLLLTDPYLYDGVFLPLEESSFFKWDYHSIKIIDALNKGAGLSNSNKYDRVNNDEKSNMVAS